MCNKFNSCSTTRDTLVTVLKQRVTQRLASFQKEEDGAVVALTLFIFLLFLAMGGIGVDMMRHEMERSNLQSTLDSAVLAGASTSDEATAKAAVEDYFAKSSMSQYLNEIGEDDIEVTMSNARVTASADMLLNTYLMKFSGIDQLQAGGESTAEKHIPRLEIVMALDISSSMEDNNKITNLQTAATEFVNEVMGHSSNGNVVISIVPYSTSVTPSDEIADVVAGTEWHDYSSCLYFESNDYNHASLGTGNHALSEGTPVKQQIYTSMYGGYRDLDPDYRTCITDESARIFPYSISKSDLLAKIAALEVAASTTTDQDTSTDQGVKWASGMLHPTFREVSAALIALNNGTVDPLVAPHPVDYDDPDVLKIMIVMGDGENTTTHYFDKSNPEFRGAHSDVFRVVTQTMEFDYGYYKNDRDTLYDDPEDEARCLEPKFKCFYKPAGNPLETLYLHDSTPDGDNDYYNLDHNADESAESPWLSDADWDVLTDKINNPEFVSVEDLDWEITWGLISPYAYGEITGNWDAFNEYQNSEQITGSMKDERMGRVCTASKTEGAIHYTIGFEVAEGGNAEAALRGCASSNAHYFRAEGLDITDAFSAIAQNIQNLRLTQ